jgi:hypothetical protein
MPAITTPVIISWCPNSGCDPCASAPKFFCVTNRSISTTISVFRLSPFYTGPVVDRLSNEAAGDPPGSPGAGAAGWPGYIANTFVMPTVGFFTVSSDVSYVPLIGQGGEVVNDSIGSDFDSVIQFYDPSKPNEYWGFCSESGGFTWNEPEWLGDPTHTHTVGDGGGGINNIWYKENAVGPDGEGNFTYSVETVDSDGPDVSFYCNILKIWTRVDQITLHSVAEVLYFNTIDEYNLIADTGFTTNTNDGSETVQTIFSVGSVQALPA